MKERKAKEGDVAGNWPAVVLKKVKPRVVSWCKRPGVCEGEEGAYRILVLAIRKKKSSLEPRKSYIGPSREPVGARPIPT